MQDALEKNRTALEANSISYISRDEIGKHGFPPRRKEAGLNPAALWRVALGRALWSVLRLRRGEIVALSEELLLGAAPDLLEDPPYSNAEVVAQPLQRRGGEVIIRLFFLSDHSKRFCLPATHRRLGRIRSRKVAFRL